MSIRDAYADFLWSSLRGGMPAEAEYTVRHEPFLGTLAVLFRPVRRYVAGAERDRRTDPLMGLGNRGFFDYMLEREIAFAMRNGPLTLQIADLDGLKGLNDKKGHQTGDSALRDVGNALQKTIRGSDWVFRYGGDEVARIMRETPLKGGVEAAERLLHDERLGELLHGYGLTVSIGMTSYDGSVHPEDNSRIAKRLVEEADSAMYKAKDRRDGKSNICVYCDGRIQAYENGRFIDVE